MSKDSELEKQRDYYRDVAFAHIAALHWVSASRDNNIHLFALDNPEGYKLLVERNYKEWCEGATHKGPTYISVRPEEGELGVAQTTNAVATLRIEELSDNVKKGRYRTHALLHFSRGSLHVSYKLDFEQLNSLKGCVERIWMKSHAGADDLIDRVFTQDD